MLAAKGSMYCGEHLIHDNTLVSFKDFFNIIAREENNLIDLVVCLFVYTGIERVERFRSTKASNSLSS